MPGADRTIHLVHAQAGRTRFRLPWLTGDSAAARRIAEELARMEGVIEVRARPRTGSILLLHATSLRVEGLGAALQALTGGEVRTEPAPPGPEEAPGGVSKVGRSILELFGDLDRRVRVDTEGRLDLATLTALGFFGLGALSVVAAREIPAPRWFHLAWWGVTILRDQAFALAHPGVAPAPDGHGG